MRASDVPFMDKCRLFAPQLWAILTGTLAAMGLSVISSASIFAIPLGVAEALSILVVAAGGLKMIDYSDGCWPELPDRTCHNCGNLQRLLDAANNDRNEVRRALLELK